MDINQFLTDANTLMQQIASAAEKTLVIGTELGKIIEKGRQILVVLITPLRPPPKPETVEHLADADLEPVGKSGPITTKSDVAILVDINRRMLMDVGRYLQEQNIDADLIIVTNDEAYSDKVKFLDPAKPEEWEEIAAEFNAAVGKIKRAVGKAQLRIFLATPLPLAVAMGSLMGTVDEGTIIYHWEKGTYWPVITISRRLRQQ